MATGAERRSSVRVLIADDSALARSLIRAWLEAEPDFEVVGEASNGSDAVQQVLRLRPDVVTMDLDMPTMNGLQSIEAIMCTQAVPILVLSSIQDAEQSCEALNLGAVEVMVKPESGSAQVRHLVDRVRLLAGVSVITRRRTLAPTDSGHVVRLAQAPESPAAPSGVALPMPPKVLAIAASTGGPQALVAILSRLPARFPWSILVAQHIVEGFAAGMVDWLGGLCRLPVHLAAEGDMALPGRVYVSPSEKNLKLEFNRHLTLQPPDPSDIYHPNCNLLLESVAENCGRDAVGLILSGMGSDGVRGIAAIQAAGGISLAQDEDSSVIYGMNRVAIEAGVVHHVLPVEKIADTLCRLVQGGHGAESSTGAYQ